MDTQPAKRGRPSIAKGVESVDIKIRCTPEQKAKFQRLGGPTWFRLAVDCAADDGTVDAASLARHPAVFAESSRMFWEAFKNSAQPQGEGT